MERYKIIKKLGEGSFGSVWKAINKENGEVVAIKTMKRKYNSWEECLNLPEVKSLRKMNHAHIVKLKEVMRELDTLYCVFEYMDCNLHQLIRCKGKVLCEAEIKTRCLQVFQGLAYMHGQGYFHRDLKPENLLVSENVIKIGDLGSAREINSAPPYTDYVTTRWYRAPEVMLCSRKYGSAVDMWAMGAIMAELFTLRPLFPGSSTLDQMYKICSVIGTPTKSKWFEGLNLASAINYKFPECNGVPLSNLIPSANADAINLITALCSWDPWKRPTALEALRHPFFKSCYAVPPTLGYRPSVDRMPPSGITMSAIEKRSYPLHFGISPDLKPASIIYPSNPLLSTTDVPYKVVVNNQGVNKNRSFSKAVARPNPKYRPPATDIPDWTMAELMRHPTIMKKLQNEVREIAIGKPNITEDDIENLHYLKAVIKETLRVHTPIPLLMPRECIKNTNVMGYEISAGTQVIINAWAIARDPFIWKDPEEFKPERFLNSLLDYKGHDFEFILFGAGRRGCPAMNFSMKIDELVLANVVLKFDFSLPSGEMGKDLDMSECSVMSVTKKNPLIVVATPVNF